MWNVLLLIVLTACSFWPCLLAGFVYWDDDLHLLNNPAVFTHSFENLWTIFTTVVNKTYIALTIFTFSIEHYFFGFDPFIYHFNNLLLHGIIVLGIYFLALLLGLHKKSAFLSALIFSIHPMHVESVAWVTQRKDLVYSLFYILSMINYWQFLNSRKSKCYWQSVLFGILSILAKPMALSLPLTLLLLDWYRHRALTKEAIINKLPFVATIVPLANITYQLNARTPQIVFPDFLLIWIWSATFYIKKFFTPFVLLPLYQLPQPLNLTNPAYLSSCLILVAIGLAIWHYRQNKLLLFAVGFYAASTFFLWRYDNTVDITIVGDRFMYLPSLGFCLWIGAWINERLRANAPVMGVTIVMIIGLMVLTNRQCRIWTNDLTLWGHELKYESKSALAYNSYGAALFRARRPDEAIHALNRAIAINPSYAIAFYNRGKIFAEKDQYSNALADFTQALNLKPDHSNSYLARAVLLSKQGLDHEALNDLNAALLLNPEDARILNNRGIVYKRLGMPQQATNDFIKAVRLAPHLKAAQINLERMKGD